VPVESQAQARAQQAQEVEFKKRRWKNWSL
jgi:hypothetical protein